MLPSIEADEAGEADFRVSLSGTVAMPGAVRSHK